ncbi:Cysteine-rich repeat secretory protein 11 [Hibiscus syriacus]|uniref:Cysteine-rich repeat secretory protein 11 n=1 Tax=Hibiscus syriacus TaxID=106335 RepID=A0A6A2XLV9_HIBSY|nr:Cysteine-rich repeat secretory protein 11 [Hibiscus syriacus]
MVESGSEITTLVYKGCAKQAFTDPAGLYSQALSALFQTLVSQSMKLNCVSQLPSLSNKLCGSRTIGSRIQLHGCYMLYEVAGFAQISGMQMLFKTCGVAAAANGGGNGFEQKMDTAFSFLENGVVTNHGFFTINYQSVYVLGNAKIIVVFVSSSSSGQNSGKTVAIILGGGVGVGLVVLC